MIRGRAYLAGWLLVVTLCWGCAEVDDPAASFSARRSLNGGDGSAKDAPLPDVPLLDAPLLDLSGSEQGAVDLRSDFTQAACGAVTAVGCCAGETLWWCTKGGLKSEPCHGKPKCGWNSAGFYDCNTSGVDDPTGGYPRACAVGDAGVPPGDLGGDGTSTPCGDVPLEGCCAGRTLRYCEDGALKVISCAFNPRCGWFAAGKYYDCGTTGEADPAGLHPQVCPGASLADAGGEGGTEAAPVLDLGGDTGPPPDGCGSCELKGVGLGAEFGGGLWVGLLLALLLALRRRPSP